MPSSSTPISQVLKQAYEALQRGDKKAARHWAQIAARIAPQMEDPWLILAAVAKPKASIAYLERALGINPHSERARKGLEWAGCKLKEQTQHVRVTGEKPSHQFTAPIGIRPVAQIGKQSSLASSRAGSEHRFPYRSLMLLLMLFLSAAWVFWPGMGIAPDGTPGASAGQGNPVLARLQDALSKSTHTPSVTATFTPTATSTFTPSPTSTATLTPTLTTTPLPTETPTPPEWLMEGEFVAPVFPEGGEKLIVVSISEQHLYAYQGDELVFSFIASTGMDNATRPGTYQILDKIPDAYASTWNIWMPNWMGIYQAGGLENGIHGLPIMQNGKRLWAGVLGAPISYGCVVLGVEESLALYNWAEVGVKVRIDY